jgi:DNA-binding transcriptional MerR regulator
VLKKMKRVKRKKYKTKDICSIFDISKATLFRWEKEGLISSIGRDWRNWRLYSERTFSEIETIIKKRNERRSLKDATSRT